MNKKQQEALREELHNYFMKAYGASREEIDHAINLCGLVKTKINTYFVVRSHEQKKKDQSS